MFGFVGMILGGFIDSACGRVLHPLWMYVCAAAGLILDVGFWACVLSQIGCAQSNIVII